MSRNDKIALAALAMALAAVVIACWLENPVSFAAIDPGWATLLAAVLGLLAIAYQTRVGFKGLRAAAIDQARLDREARQHQSELTREVESLRERRALRVMAAALAAELFAASTQVSTRISIFRTQREFYEKNLGIASQLKSVNEIMFSIETSIYTNNASNLGLLGPSLAHDVVDLYSRLIFRFIGSVDKLSGAQMAEVMGSLEQFYERWKIDQVGVAARLLDLAKSDLELPTDA